MYIRIKDFIADSGQYQTCDFLSWELQLDCIARIRPLWFSVDTWQFEGSR